jgi:DnaJ-class molecular chaperone
MPNLTWTLVTDINGQRIGEARFCRTCDGRMYVENVDVDAHTCPTCDGAGVFWKEPING